MMFLFFEIWVWLLVAFFLGGLVHWLLCCRGKNNRDTTQPEEGNQVAAAIISADSQVKTNEVSTDIAVDESWKPLGFSQRPDDANDLKRIKGIGGVIEETLHELGVFKFDQIAEWNDENVAWVDNFLSFPGRIDREDWRTQARALAKGEVTEFAARVDKGDIDY